MIGGATLRPHDLTANTTCNSVPHLARQFTRHILDLLYMCSSLEKVGYSIYCYTYNSVDTCSQ